MCHFGFYRAYRHYLRGESTLEAFVQPAGTALYPRLIAKEKYTASLSLSGALSRTAEIVGVGLAGVLIGLLGVAGALFIDAGCFFLSGAVLATLRVAPAPKTEVTSPWLEFMQNTRKGFRYVRKNKLALAICISACALNFALAPLSSLQTAYVNESLHLGAEALSVMGIELTAGMSIGSALFPALVKGRTRFDVLFAGVLGTTVAYIALALVPLVAQEWLKWALMSLMMLVLGVCVALPTPASTSALWKRLKRLISRGSAAS